MIVREITVAITTLYTVFHKKWEAFKEMDARISGKLATLGQFVLFLVILLFPEKAMYVLILASCCSIAAGIDYGRLFFKALRRQSN